MFIRNSEKMNFSNVYTCNEKIGNYLIKQGFPLLGRENNGMKFSNTEELQRALEHLPLKFRIFKKVGVK